MSITPPRWENCPGFDHDLCKLVPILDQLLDQTVLWFLGVIGYAQNGFQENPGRGILRVISDFAEEMITGGDGLISVPGR